MSSTVTGSYLFDIWCMQYKCGVFPEGSWSRRQNWVRFSSGEEGRGMVPRSRQNLRFATKHTMFAKIWNTFVYLHMMSFCPHFETPERKISIEHSFSQYFPPLKFTPSRAVSAAPPAFKFCRLPSFQVSEQSPNPLSSLGMGQRLHFESGYILHCSPVNRTAVFSAKNWLNKWAFMKVTLTDDNNLTSWPACYSVCFILFHSSGMHCLCVHDLPVLQLKWWNVYFLWSWVIDQLIYRVGPLSGTSQKWSK